MNNNKKVCDTNMGIGTNPAQSLNAVDNGKGMRRIHY